MLKCQLTAAPDRVQICQTRNDGCARFAASTRAKPADARLSREFKSFAQMDLEQKEVRIWGGIHFRNSLEVGEAMGRKIADHLVANYLKPTR
jgi:hypothetical protein